jgi:endonuclease/exonuclease/phosphatase family metal-dependent hydrolase
VLRVVTYNVHGLRGDRAALVDVVRDLDPDVLIVQEAPRRLRWRTRNAHLAHDLGLVYVAGGAPSLGNVILTSLRVRTLETWALRYPLTPGRHLRGAVFARCAVAEGPFVVVGSHLATDPTERPGQARLLAKALADVDVPVILGADLNEPPGGSSWQLLADGLVDAAGADGAGTFPAAAPGRRIDAILTDPRIAVTGYRVADPPAARRASDHLPVVAELALPGVAAG